MKWGSRAEIWLIFRTYFKTLVFASTFDTSDWLKTNRTVLLARVSFIRCDFIGSAQGLQYFPYLESFQSSGSSPDGDQLKSLDLRANTRLTVLSLDNHLFSSIDLSQNTVLKDLSLNNTPLKSINLTKNTLKLESLNLSQNTGLIYLRMGFDYIDYQGLLKTLDIRGFRDPSSRDLRILRPAQFTHLRTLKVHENFMKDKDRRSDFKEFENARGTNLTIEVYSAAAGSTDYSLVNGTDIIYRILTGN